MKRALLFFALVFTACMVYGTVLPNMFRSGFARLQYDGGGDWYNDPEVLPNLARYANSVLNTSFPIDQAALKATDARLYDHPFVYITGHGNIRFTDREIENLRAWMLRGGFLYADDDYGMDQSFRREIKRVFPEYDLVELDASYPLFTCFYDFSSGLPKIHEHDGKPPQAFGIFDENGRMMVFYTYESNISDGWADASTHNNPPEVREKALKFGTNIVYYLLTR
ncbi:MAG: DUF4159 domain-containing protein [Candidatus Cloacimonadaceae bacterium]|nr:DUF4159 domain-containing protein [Candidatus Cloacimonadaceae bacterium]